MSISLYKITKFVIMRNFYTVVSDDGNIDITVRHTHQKNTYALSGTVIYGDMSSCEQINVDFILDTGKIIHKESWTDHMSDQVRFDFNDVEWGSKVKIHVYKQNGKAYKQTNLLWKAI